MVRSFALPEPRESRSPCTGRPLLASHSYCFPSHTRWLKSATIRRGRREAYFLRTLSFYLVTMSSTARPPSAPEMPFILLFDCALIGYYVAICDYCTACRLPLLLCPHPPKAGTSYLAQCGIHRLFTRVEVTAASQVESLEEASTGFSVRPGRRGLLWSDTGSVAEARWGCSETHARLIGRRTRRRGWLSSADAQTNLYPTLSRRDRSPTSGRRGRTVHPGHHDEPRRAVREDALSA